MSCSQQLGRAAGVGAHAFRLLFEMLYTRDRKLDQRLDEFRDRPAPPRGVPQGLPLLVRFPVEAVVEQVDPAQVRPACLPLRWIKVGDRVRGAAEAVAGGV